MDRLKHGRGTPADWPRCPDCERLLASSGARMACPGCGTIYPVPAPFRPPPPHPHGPRILTESMVPRPARRSRHDQPPEQGRLL